MASVAPVENADRPAARGGALRTLLMALFLGPWTTLWGGLCFVLGSPRRRQFCTSMITTWGRGIVKAGGIRVAPVQQAPLDPEQRYIFLSNHQSALDIPILLSACPKQSDARFMAKESLFKIPFLGWGMSRTGFVPIRRENARHSAELFQEIQRAKIEYSYIIFPEGTRSPDGRLQPFKRGSIGMALRMNLPIVPVTIVDACRANPKGTYCIRAGTIQVIFHAPISPSAETTRDEVLAKVYTAVLSGLPEDQRPLPENAVATGASSTPIAAQPAQTRH